MIQARKYGWVMLTSARSNLAYLAEVATRTVFLAVILFVFLHLWRVTYGAAGAYKLGGLTLPQMLWYLAVTEAIALSGVPVSDAVDEDVRTGALAVQLIRPLSYPLYRLGAALGERAVRFCLNLVVGAVLALLLVGPLQFSVTGLLFFALSVPLAFVLDFLPRFLIGLGAFWMENTSGLALIYTRMTMLLGGMMLPLTIFPDRMQPWLRALPFSSVMYGPARMFVRPDLGFLASLVERQAAAIVVFSAAVGIVYKIAESRIHANGG